MGLSSCLAIAYWFWLEYGYLRNGWYWLLVMILDFNHFLLTSLIQVSLSIVHKAHKRSADWGFYTGCSDDGPNHSLVEMALQVAKWIQHHCHCRCPFGLWLSDIDPRFFGISSPLERELILHLGQWEVHMADHRSYLHGRPIDVWWFIIYLNSSSFVVSSLCKFMLGSIFTAES